MTPDTTDGPPIVTDGLTKYYGDTRGIEDLTLTVEGGEIFGFLGPNGAGKTTTIRTLLGFQSPTGGSASVLGHDVTDRAAMVGARERIGYLPGEPSFDETVTGRRLIDYYGRLRGDERSEELLETFDPPLDRTIGEYSRGNEQMLAIVVAFMHDPDLLIMDEPTSGLDPLKQEGFYEFLRSERDRGKTIFFSSHVLSEVRKVCDRVGIIRQGHLVEVETLASLLERNGKVVRVRVAGRIGPDAFEMDGAHDVTVTGRAAATDGGGSDGSVDGNEGDDGGLRDVRESTTASFTYTGGYDALLDRLVEHRVLDLEIEEAPLEDVFMRFYGDAPDGTTDAAGTGTTPDPAADHPGGGT